MVPGSLELWFAVLVFLLFSIPVLVWGTAALNRTADDDRDEELEELRQRVEELESERE